MNDSGESRLQEYAQRHLRRNYTAHLFHGMLGQAGFRLIQLPTFIPLYVHMLSGSDLVVGLARACQATGQFLTPIFSANLIEHRRRVMPVAFLVGGAMRIQILGIALAGFWLSREHNVVAVCLLLGLFGFFLGMQGVVFNFLVSKVIPVERRGVLQGLRNALGGVVNAGVAVYGGLLVERNALGNGYAATFLISFALTAAGLLTLAFMKEPESPSVRDPSPLLRRLRELPHLLRSDPGFTRYFLARALGTLGRTSMPFYILLAQQRVELSGVVLAQLSVAFTLAQSVVNVGWGMLADRRGFRAAFLASIAAWTLASVVLLVAHDPLTITLGYLGLGAGLGGFMMTGQNLVLEFGSRANLPMRIAVANSASELMNVVGPLLGGLLAAVFSYQAAIGVAVAFKVLAFGVTAFWVDEPRHRVDGPH